MFPASTLNKISNALSGVPGINEDVKKQLLGVVKNQLHKLDLVSREDFEVQQKTLQKTREIVNALEKRVAELEQQAQ